MKIYDRLNVKVKKEQTKLNVNFAELKAGGFIKQRQKDLFTVRLRVPGGRMPAERLGKIVKIAKKYSKTDFLHLTARQSLEIPFVNIGDFNSIKADLNKIGQGFASCGPRVRVPNACGGCEYNSRGIIDAQKFAMRADKKFFGIQTEHGKLKISFSGCHADCTRAKSADIGFVGEIEPKWNKKECTGCGLCAKACLEGAIISNEKTGRPDYDFSKCIFCGDCVKVCPTSSWFGACIACALYAGGKYGRHPRAADLIMHLFPQEKINSVIKDTIDWYKKNGSGSERLGITFDRVGLEKYKTEVIKPLTGGAE